MWKYLARVRSVLQAARRATTNLNAGDFPRNNCMLPYVTRTSLAFVYRTCATAGTRWRKAGRPLAEILKVRRTSPSTGRAEAASIHWRGKKCPRGSTFLMPFNIVLVLHRLVSGRRPQHLAPGVDYLPCARCHPPRRRSWCRMMCARRSPSVGATGREITRRWIRKKNRFISSHPRPGGVSRRRLELPSKAMSRRL